MEYENWLELDKTKKVEFFSYWNDEENEDEFNIKDGDLGKLENYIENTGLVEDIENILAFLSKRGIHVKGRGLDVAAGILWATSYFLRTNQSIEKISCLEFSKHRLLALGPVLLKLYGIDEKKVKLILGDFYNIKMEKESVDFIILSQALHHAADPNLLLRNLYRILKREGIIFVVGDLFISRKLYLKCYANYILTKFLKKIFIKNDINIYFIKKFLDKEVPLSFQKSYFPPDPITGDHYHLRSQYYEFFLNNKFYYKEFKASRRNHLSFLLSKEKI